MIVESVVESFMVLVVSVVLSKESEKAVFNYKSLGLCFNERRIILLSDDISYSICLSVIVEKISSIVRRFLLSGKHPLSQTAFQFFPILAKLEFHDLFINGMISNILLFRFMYFVSFNSNKSTFLLSLRC